MGSNIQYIFSRTQIKPIHTHTIRNIYNQAPFKTTELEIEREKER